MELKQLVPPFGLCNLIPEGEFEDSAVDGAMKLWLKTKGIDYGKVDIR
jgi:hypothetical protein